MKLEVNAAKLCMRAKSLIIGTDLGLYNTQYSYAFSFSVNCWLVEKFTCKTWFITWYHLAKVINLKLCLINTFAYFYFLGVTFIHDVKHVVDLLKNLQLYALSS